MTPGRAEEHQHRDGEDLLALLLHRHRLDGFAGGDVARRRELDAARACPLCAEELASLETLLDDVGQLVAEDAARDVARDERLAQAVFASTTREDLGWRGDWRLIGDFLRTRLAESRVLRVAAASLLAHLVALPVLAYVVLNGAPARAPIFIDFEPPAESLFAPLEAEPRPEIDVPQVPVDTAPDDGQAERDDDAEQRR